jgi:DNA-binding transcriptional ArsR family regulator
MVIMNSSPFGGGTRTRVLLALSLLVESYPRELARVLDAPLSGVQRALQSLEVDGIAAGLSVGRTRVFQLDPRYFARDALKQFLRRLVEPEVGLQKQVAALRRRPRRTGKPLGVRRARR